MKPQIGTSYGEAVRFLGTFLNYSKVRNYEVFETVAEDLADFRRALRALGDPHLQYSAVHVAGSKAKGSTCSFLYSVLRTAGFRTGLLTSPHLLEFTERVSLDGIDIPPAEFGHLMTKFRALLPDGQDPADPRMSRRLLCRLGLRHPPSVKRHFRNAHAYQNGIAFQHFANGKADFAVIETGMGGRLDHTNVFDEPAHCPGGTLTSVITTMAFEHTIALGTTMRPISEHKAGIIQAHGITVLGPQRPDWYGPVCEAVEARRKAVGAPPVLDTNTTIHTVPGTELFSPHGAEAEYRCDRPRLDSWLREAGASDGGAAAELVAALTRGIRLHSPLAGRHQAENLRTVLGCAVALGVRGVNIPLERLEKGIASTVWPARFEILSHDPLVIVDCCHEALSIEAFSRAYREFYGDRPVVAVTGFLRDNDVAAMCRAMVPHLPLKHLVCCWPDIPVRAMDPEKAIEIAAPILGVPMTPVSTPDEALALGFEMRTGNDALLVFSDFYIAGTARKMIPQWLANRMPG
jgi:dihydrofolate synthase/folylpolyglutamate synthase